VTDDSDVIQRVINANVNGKVVYFPHGNYIIGKTVKVPSGTRMVGELWSVLMAGGPAFQVHIYFNRSIDFSCIFTLVV